MSSARQRGGLIEVRGDDGRKVAKVTVVKSKQQTARAMVRAMSNNMYDYYAKMHDIAMGKPHIYRDEHGRESEPVFPSMDVQRQAAKDLIEMVDGKAVPQTEVIAAEAERQKMAQLEAMSDEQLWAIASAKREALSLPAQDEPEHTDSERDESD